MTINSNIIIGVTGGIAAYKTPILIRRLKEQGAEVTAVMTQGAKHFITPLTLQAVSGQGVRDSLLDADAESGMDHIELARWADKIIIAPATADFIAKLAHGFADDLLTTLCLATSASVYVAPAMNQQMWQNKATQANVSKIRQHGIHILGPDEGDQACGEIGPGRMLEPEQIIQSVFEQTDTSTSKHDLLSSPSILITAGPTWEALDPVRGITNHSSGQMGYSMAGAFSSAGYRTTLISGPTSLESPANVNRVNVISAQQMHDAVHDHIEAADIFISVAAVADYRPVTVEGHKIKKSADTMQINLVRNPDILKSVTALESHPFTVGFAAETNNVLDYAKAKLINKKLDMIIANEVGEGKAFGQLTNTLTLISPEQTQSLGPDSKTNLAKQLVTIITDSYEKKHSVKGT